MIVTNIGRDKSYEMYGSYGLKIWDKVSVSGTLSPGEDIQQAYKELDKILEEAHQQTLSQLEEFRGTKVRDVVEEPVGKIENNIMVDILSCKELKVLQSYKLIVKNKPDLEAAYAEMEKKLKK